FDRDPNSIKGCSTKMRGYLTSYFGEKKPGTLDAARGALLDSVGYPITRMAMHCEAADGHDAAAHILHEAIVHQAKRSHEGPRSAAYEGALDALTTLPETLQDQLAHYFPANSPRYEPPKLKGSIRLINGGGARAQMASEELQSEIASVT